MLFLDTSALAKLYVAEEETAALMAVILQQSDSIPFTPLHELELTSALERRVGARELAAAARDRVLAHIDADLTAGVLSRVEVNWSSALADAIQLVRKHGARRGLRTLDALHLSMAVGCGADVFITYDQHQAAVARAETLKVLQPH